MHVSRIADYSTKFVSSAKNRHCFVRKAASLGAVNCQMHQSRKNKVMCEHQYRIYADIIRAAQTDHEFGYSSSEAPRRRY